MRLPPQTGCLTRLQYTPSGTNNIPALAAVKSCAHQKQKDDGSLCLISVPLEKRGGN